jgi:hypothetical protein
VAEDVASHFRSVAGENFVHHLRALFGGRFVEELAINSCLCNNRDIWLHLGLPYFQNATRLPSEDSTVQPINNLQRYELQRQCLVSYCQRSIITSTLILVSVVKFSLGVCLQLFGRFLPAL